MIAPGKTNPDENNPLESMDEWEDDLLRRYPEADAPSAFTDPNKKEEQFRDYESTTRDTVREFYRLNHRYHHVVEPTPFFVDSKIRVELSNL